MNNNLPRNEIRNLSVASFSKMLSFTLFFVLTAFYAQAVTVTISGPSSVCPLTNVTYTASTKQFGQEISNCTITWRVYKNGVSVHYVPLGGKTFSYYFPDPANYKIEVYAISCGIYGDSPGAFLNITSRVKPPYPISGPSQVCTPGGTYTYNTTPTIDQVADPGCDWHYSYYWTAPSGWIITASGTNTFFGGTPVNITIPSGTANGTYTIKVQSTIPYGSQPYQSNSWYSTPVTYTVRVGPYPTPSLSVPSEMCPNSYYTFYASGASTYEWIVSGDISIQSGTSYSSLYVYTNSSFSGGYVQVRGNNGCGGWTAYTGRPLVLSYYCPYSAMLDESINIYPVPASSDLNVEWPDSIKVSSIELYDKNSKQIKKQQPKTNSAKIDVSKIKEDEYYLHVFSDKGILRKKILIKR